MSCYPTHQEAVDNAPANLWISYVVKKGEEHCAYWYGFSEWLFFLLIGFMALLSLFTACGLIFFFFRRRFKDGCRAETREERVLNYEADAKPAITAIIPCFLPNEKGIIVETVEKVMTRVRSPGPLTVFVVYNTPEDIPETEQKLQQMQARRDWYGPDNDQRTFKTLRVMESKSKAANLNAALKATQDDYVIIYDADHWPDPNSLLLLWEKMYRLDQDCVQGSYYMRNLERNQWGCFPPCAFPCLARIIDAEFFVDWFYMKLLTRTFFMGRAYFSGSNALWDKESLMDLQFDTDAQTEDVDMAIRQLMTGKDIEFCAESRSGELAPQGCCACWKQRLRWSMGWDEVSMKHMNRMFGDDTVSCRTRCGLVWTFIFRWLLMGICFGATAIFLPYEFIYSLANSEDWVSKEAHWGKGLAVAGTMCFFLGFVPMTVATIEAIFQVGHRGRQSCIQVFFVAFVSSPIGFACFFIFSLFLQCTSCFKVCTNTTGGWVVTARGATIDDPDEVGYDDPEGYESS